MTEHIVELTYSIDVLQKHSWLLKMDFDNLLSMDLPSIGDGVSFASLEAQENAELVVTHRKFVYEPGQTTVIISLGLSA